MDRWLAAALDYVPEWIGFQMRLTEQPGCSLAIAHKGKVVLEQAWGHANLKRATELTPRHRFRVASHSKSFTAAGIMKLREKGKLQLDDPAGRHVKDLHPKVAQATIAQLLSHTSGIIRDGTDTGQWVDRRPFRSANEIRADLTLAQPIEANTRFKYSNHAFGLAGLVIESVTGEPYNTWIKREVVDAAGLEETRPDMPVPKGAPLARGHSWALPLGRRVIIPGDNSTHGLASATGFISTAADLARFFNQLSPNASRSILSVASRREMTRRQWRVPHSAVERWYGLGTISGSIGGWDYFGHSGGFQGFITRTGTIAAHDLTLSVLTNAADGLAHPWLEGIVHILRRFRRKGAPTRRVADWGGRWWSLWGCFDYVPVGDRVMVATPALLDPFMDASEIEVTGRAKGRVVLAGGFASHGEEVSRKLSKSGRTLEVKMTGMRLLDEEKIANELVERYER
ncbi:MAG: class A beta-lactamase-related serine hydrolase [Alphaproteobacteria bacterium]|nr:class A beta-lactamase-related serine hydrolase [Alphaproteobacteria bacterium]